MSGELVQFPPDRIRRRDDPTFTLGISLGQARAVIQLLIGAAQHGTISCCDVMDEHALSQALWAVDEQLGKALKALEEWESETTEVQR